MRQINVAAIGADRQIQDPRRAFENAEGRYHDAAAGLTPAQKYPNFGKASPDPNPFQLRR